jgi:hypothetical protein
LPLSFSRGSTLTWMSSILCSLFSTSNAQISGTKAFSGFSEQEQRISCRTANVSWGVPQSSGD